MTVAKMSVETEPERAAGTRSRSILHVLWNMDIGGAERAVYQLVREQRRHDDAADVLVASNKGFYGERSREAGATVIELRQRSALDAAAARSARSIFERYEIVHFHGAEPLLIRAAARCRGPRLFYTHRSGAFRYRPKQRARYAIAARYLRRFDGISANTLHAARAAAHVFGLPQEGVPVTYNGIDFALLEPRRPRASVLAELGMPPASLLIGASANIRDWKRLDRLVHAVAALHRERVRCVLIGDGPARPNLERLSSDLGVSDRVVFVGLKEHVADYLQVLDAFVLPSGPQESFGNAVVEAMGLGLPVVVFADGGGLMEHVDDGRTGFVVRDQPELVARLAELARSDRVRTEIGERAREVVRTRYSVGAMIDRYDRLYERTGVRAAMASTRA
jgi:glycosyltransferase involved in cell wall biosynthesis